MPRKRRRIAIAVVLAFVSAAVFALLAFNANRIIRFELERRLGRDFSVGSISLGLGGIEAENVKIKKDGELFFDAGRVVIKAGIIGFLRKRYVISALVIEKPVLYLRTDRTGKLATPFGSSNGEPKSGDGQDRMPPFELQRIEIRDGKLFYRDGKVSTPPHVTRLEEIRLDIENVRIPAGERWTGYTLSARVPGKMSTASLKLAGKTDFKTLDTDARFTLSRLDITGFKPYFQKKGDSDVTRGELDISMKLAVRAKTLDSPGRAVLRDLEFASGKGFGDKFIGAPRTLVLKMLRTGNNEIALDFVMSGRADDPKFSIAENFVKRLTVGLAQGLGLTVVDAGKAVVELGAKGVQEVGKGVKGIGTGIQKLFGK